MRIAVIGGTGLVGSHTVAAARAAGHEPVVISRSNGVDIITGAGLSDALDGVDAVVDVSNTAARDIDGARDFFSTAATNVAAAEATAGVRHHVLLSIVGVDKVANNAHYVGKVCREELALSSSVPATVLRATQFHEFAGMVVRWTRESDTATIAPVLVQPVAAREVGEVLVQFAAETPTGGRVELAGPATEDLVDMARRTLAVRGENVRLIPTWRGPLSIEMAGEVLLPGTGARLGSTTFEQWLASEDALR
ncbi:SDR family oxidoreductase [Antrihabitans cavernicola]|uniref:SDR family oxidoreductase n=1 Tax=Antrihabitans cavernicola TaxID=2495913 RepID=A0A5A7SCE9_9NOCA|nr:SDR family oxidoreductase [Spelaeibacter cavernicola]KAA0023244.1 SDR family oxidoreductase [Spelaeibacter cavernicola]